MRSIAVALLNFIGWLDANIPHKPPPQSLHPEWCNLHERECLYRCKQICLDADLPVRKSA